MQLAGHDGAGSWALAAVVATRHLVVGDGVDARSARAPAGRGQHGDGRIDRRPGRRPPRGGRKPAGASTPITAVFLRATVERPYGKRGNGS